jgi:hypothetical protein
VHPQNRGELVSATATTGVHVKLKESPLVTGGDRFPAWLVIRKEEKEEAGRLDEDMCWNQVV